MSNIKNAVISFMIKKYGITIEDFVFYIVKNNYTRFTKDNEPTDFFYEALEKTLSCYYYSLNMKRTFC